MLRKLRPRSAYDVMAAIAFFIAVAGGSAYAAATIDGSTLKNDSVAGKKLKGDTLTGTQIKESKLGKVPIARNADKLAGSGSGAFVRNGQASGGALIGRFPSPTLRCPSGMVRQSDFCFEQSLRTAAPWFDAAATCGEAERRLGTPSELYSVVARLSADEPSGEWTSTVFEFPNGGAEETRAELIFKNSYAVPSPLAHGSAVGTPQAYRCLVSAGNR